MSQQKHLYFSPSRQTSNPPPPPPSPLLLHRLHYQLLLGALQLQQCRHQLPCCHRRLHEDQKPPKTSRTCTQINIRVLWATLPGQVKSLHIPAETADHVICEVITLHTRPDIKCFGKCSTYVSIHSKRSTNICQQGKVHTRIATGKTGSVFKRYFVKKTR